MFLGIIVFELIEWFCWLKLDDEDCCSEFVCDWDCRFELDDCCDDLDDDYCIDLQGEDDKLDDQNFYKGDLILDKD